MALSNSVPAEASDRREMPVRREKGKGGSKDMRESQQHWDMSPNPGFFKIKGGSLVHEKGQRRPPGGERTGSAVEDGQDRGGEAVVALPEPTLLEERGRAGAGLADAVEKGGLGGSHDRAGAGGSGLKCG